MPLILSIPIVFIDLPFQVTVGLVSLYCSKTIKVHAKFFRLV